MKNWPYAAYGGLAGTDTNSDFKWDFPLGSPDLPHRFYGFLHGNGRLDSAFFMTASVLARLEEHHNPITKICVNGSFMFFNNIGHDIQVVIHDVEEGFWF